MPEQPTERSVKPRKPGLLQRMWGFDSRHPLWWDLGPAVFLGIVLLIGTAAMQRGPAESGYIALMVVVFTATLAWRRRRPFAMYMIQTAAMVLTYLADNRTPGDWEAPPVDGAAVFGFIMVTFNLALRCRARLIWTAAAVTALGTVLELMWTPSGDTIEEASTTVVGGIMMFGLVVMTGLVIRTRREFHQSMSDQVARQAVSEERTRIAREMHDIIGHNLAVINALADGGAYAAASSPERAGEALRAIGSTSRQALGELRRVLSVLNADEALEVAELAPQPGLAELDALIERVREAGLPVTVRVRGERWDLTENQQLAVYRTVQEALTNVLKHAPEPRRAQVTLDFQEHGVGASVGNSGPAVEDAGPMRGLAGLRERASAFGGTIEAGPQPAGGWRVALWLPRNGQTHDSQVSRLEKWKP